MEDHVVPAAALVVLNAHLEKNEKKINHPREARTRAFFTRRFSCAAAEIRAHDLRPRAYASHVTR
jgi:hypothetical protein